MDGEMNTVRSPTMDTDVLVVGGGMLSADTIETLAKTDVDAGSLRATIERCNEGVRLGVDPDFGRNRVSAAVPANWSHSRKLRTSPSHRRSQAGTNGGLTVDSSIQVRNVYGEAIPHLFAASISVQLAGCGRRSGRQTAI
jgi:hypothetical protein